MTTEAEQDISKTNPRIPFLLRIISIAIFAEGVLGLLFFVLAGIFQMSTENFTGVVGLTGFSSYFYSFYIALHVVIFSGLVLSGVFLLKLRKFGFYLFIISYLILVFLTVYTNNIFGWTAIVVGLSFFAVLAYFYKKMK